MGYAMFAQSIINAQSEKNARQREMMQVTDAQSSLTNLGNMLNGTLLAIQTGQTEQKRELYEELSDAVDSEEREQINDEIKELELAFQEEINAINLQLYDVSAKETPMENRKKNLETNISVIEKKIEEMKKAETDGIKNATPKFGNGAG